MARIAILLPRDEMLEPARRMAQRYHLDLLEVAAVHTSNVLEKAREVIAAGAEIIIARGIQAMLIKQNTTVPLVEVQLTGQEMALLVTKARGLVRKEQPAIGLVGFPNMFCDISSFDELFGVRLSTYFVDSPEQMQQATQAAIADGVDVLIGGDVVCSAAAGQKIPSVFIASGAESIGEACRMARNASYAMDQEKRNTAEFKAILDYTFSGIIQIDAAGMVLHLNHSAEQMLGQTEQQALNRPIWGLVPSLGQKLLAPVLEQGQEIYSVRVDLHKAAFMASVSPVLMEDKPAGAIICINEGKQLELYAAERRNELLLQGYTASFTFDELIARSPQAQAMVQQAKHFAQFRTPVLLLGEFGTEKEELAQCIHNASEYGGNAFVSMDCGGCPPEEAEQRLFGEHGLAEKAQGILFLNEISRLPPAVQYQVYCLITRRRCSSFGGVGGHSVPLRVIAADSRDLALLVQQGAFREDLYYALRVMTLRVPPLRERREDIPGWAEYFLRQLQQLHGRYVHLTKGAWQLLQNCDWGGNLAQLRNLCERLVVTAPRRTVDEVFLAAQMSEAFPAVQRQSPTTTVVYCDPKSARITELLKKHGGSRTAVARELGVSTTTLWRYMKKYGIEKAGL